MIPKASNLFRVPELLFLLFTIFISNFYTASFVFYLVSFVFYLDFLYSSRNAITGLTAAAFLAGTYPAMAPDTTSSAVAVKATFIFISGFAK